MSSTTPFEDYDRAIGLNSTFSQAFLNRGFARAVKGDFDRAIADYDQAIRINPDVAAAFYNRGVARARKGDLVRAIQDYDQALDLDANYVWACPNAKLMPTAPKKAMHALRAEGLVCARSQTM